MEDSLNSAPPPAQLSGSGFPSRSTTAAVTLIRTGSIPSEGSHRPHRQLSFLQLIKRDLAEMSPIFVPSGCFDPDYCDLFMWLS